MDRNPTAETVRRAIDDASNGAETSSTQVFADVVKVIGSTYRADNSSPFLESLTHDQCVTLGAMLANVAELLTLVTMSVAVRHAEVCDKNHGATRWN